MEWRLSVAPGARRQRVAIEALGAGLHNQSGGSLERYVDRRLTILWSWTTLLKLHAEIDDEPELFAA
jgi:hypothetical protein